MSAEAVAAYSATSQPVSRLIWRVSLWPHLDRQLWVQACNGEGADGLENPAVGWSDRTLKKNEDGYGRYLSWLDRQGLLDLEAPSERVTPDRIASFVVSLTTHLSPVSVGMTVGAVNAAAKAFAPNGDWSWLSRRYSRLKAKAKPSRDKRHAIQHTLDLYNYGKDLMHTADDGPGLAFSAAQRFQAGLAIALLAARPLRIRNFQAITIGESLRWDGKRYWLTFSRDETKSGVSIDEPCPADLIPYLEAFLRLQRPVLLRQAAKYAHDLTHRRLWVDRFGKPMREHTLRELIERYTEARFCIAVWPHLFRDCLLTSVAIDRPDLMQISASLLGHTSIRTGEKHYNQAQMLDASRRYSLAILDLRENPLDTLRDQQAR